jgi:hypothetical protein
LGYPPHRQVYGRQAAPPRLAQSARSPRPSRAPGTSTAHNRDHQGTERLFQFSFNCAHRARDRSISHQATAIRSHLHKREFASIMSHLRAKKPSVGSTLVHFRRRKELLSRVVAVTKLSQDECNDLLDKFNPAESGGRLWGILASRPLASRPWASSHSPSLNES